VPRDDWAPLLEDLAVRHAAVLAMGGPDRLAQLAERRRLDVRTRLAALLDPESFVEYGALVGSVQRGALPPAPADAFVCGHATIASRRVLVGASDPTVMGGSVGLGTLAKRRRLIALAERTSRPLILLLDGPGLRTRHPNDQSPWVGDELRDLARLAARVPVVAVILGPVAGHDALVAASASHVVMTRRTAVFGAGPPMVLATTGVEIGTHDLGGPDVHAEVLVDHVAEDEPAALAHVRAWVTAVGGATAGGSMRPEPVPLRSVVPADPSTPYDLDAVLVTIADPDAWRRDDAPAGGLVTGTATIGGRTVAVVASDPAHDDARIDVAGATAARARLDAAAAAGEPVLVLVDSPGPALGEGAERAGTSRAVAALLAAVAAHPTPMLVVVVRRAHGDVPSILGLGPGVATVVALGLPGARIGPLPAETASAAVGLTADVEALLEHAEFGGAIDAADQLLVDRVVDPADLRTEILAGLELTDAVSR
jgi:acetyl-CoA carboxylase carboxyltransferase component